MKTDTPIPENEVVEEKAGAETPATPEETPEKPTEEVAPEESPEETPQESSPSASASNDPLAEKILRFYPGADISTPEAKMEAADRLLGALIPIHDKIYDLVETSPVAAATLNDWMETGSLPKAIARNYDPEETQALIAEIKDPSYEEDRNAFSTKNQQRKDRETKLKNNMEVSLNEIASYMEDKKDWDEEKATAFADFVKKHYEDGWDGLISKKDLQILEKGFVFDEEVANAEETGKIAGRNEQIIAGKKSKKDVEELLPELAAGASTPEAKEPEPQDSFMGGLKALASRKPILS